MKIITTIFVLLFSLTLTSCFDDGHEPDTSTFVLEVYNNGIRNRFAYDDLKADINDSIISLQSGTMRLSNTLDAQNSINASVLQLLSQHYNNETGWAIYTTSVTITEYVGTQYDFNIMVTLRQRVSVITSGTIASPHWIANVGNAPIDIINGTAPNFNDINHSDYIREPASSQPTPISARRNEFRNALIANFREAAENGNVNFPENLYNNQSIDNDHFLELSRIIANILNDLSVDGVQFSYLNVTNINRIHTMATIDNMTSTLNITLYALTFSSSSPQMVVYQ